MAQQQKSSPLRLIQPSPSQASALSSQLMQWYDAEKRDLPWRRTRDPYAIMVSEFMLQQTQVATVIPYYERFMEEFPTVQSLAEASEQSVLRAWAGLGYYSRARNLRAAAQRIVEVYGGNIPDQFGDLLFLPGVGRYMAGAVASMAFGRCAPAVDTNVVRILCRIYAADVDAKSVSVRRDLEDLVLRLIPRDRPGDFNQALMDLGARICTAQEPVCGKCPIASMCRGLQSGKPERFPFVAKPVEVEEVTEACGVIRKDGRYFVAPCGTESGRFRGMWEFPTVGLTGGEEPEKALAGYVRMNFGLGICVTEEWASIRHQVTHHRITKRVFLCGLRERPHREDNSVGEWVEPENLRQLPMGSAHRKIADLLGESGSFFGME